MKLICAEYNEEKEMTVSVIGDNALLRNNGDFYYPSFTRQLSCVPQVVVRACKLGKGISEHFAGRYYNEIGLGIRFYADTLEEELREKKLPCGVAAAFDDSAALSGMQAYPEESLSYRFAINGEEVFKADISELPVNIDRFVAQASQFYMIKIGDFFYCGNPFRYRQLKIGDRLSMYLGNKCLLDFYIR